MKITENTKYILATLGLLLLGAGYAAYTYGEDIRAYFIPRASEPVHVHADFSFYVQDERIDLTGPQYQSSPESVKHPYMHFHDGVDTMIHRHKEGVTLGEFFTSLGLGLSSSCVTLLDGASYCTDASNSLVLYVNDRAVANPASYVVQEEDRILLYYGDPRSENIEAYQQDITNEACIYSGTCPERGEPPFESCGITCEIVN